MCLLRPGPLLLTACFFFSPIGNAGWERVDPSTHPVETLFTGIPESEWPTPSCSGAPMPIFDASGNLVGIGDYPEQLQQFAFFVDRPAGDIEPAGLLIYFGGGGACWDGATCLGSALTPASTYYPVFGENVAILEAGSATDAGGILNRSAIENPYRDYTKIVIPYCTGDVHIGSKDQQYFYQLPDGTGFEWEIHHRGFDNLQYVLRWLQLEQESEGWDFDDTTIAGSSAGGYGAAINAPAIIGALGGDSDYSLIIDSSNGVLTNGFVAQAFGTATQDGVWGARENLSPFVGPALELDSSKLWSAVIESLSDAYPGMRISQSTAAYDAVQTLVRMIMRSVDDLSYNPYLPPPSEAQIALNALLDWSPRARASMIATALKVRNYRYYLGAGEGHIHLIDPPPPYFFPTTNYYDENSARGVYYTNWLDDMLNNPRRFFGTDWRNLSCFPNCLP